MKIFFLRVCAVWRRFRRGALRHHTDHAQYLPQIESLMRRADPDASWHARANWMIDLADWIRREPKVSLLDDSEWRRVKHQRIRFLLDWLDGNRDVKQGVQATLRKTLREATGPELFSATGLPRESAFFSELSERMVKLILPRPVGQQDLSTLFTAMFPDESDAEWLLELDVKTLSRLWKLGGDDGIAHGYRQQIDEAMLYLVTMVISVGISPAFRQRLEPRMPLLATPFMSLRRELENYLLGSVKDEAGLRSVRMLLAVCQAQTDKIYAHLDEYGVSVGLVYHVERMRAHLVRIARLLDLRGAPHADAGSGQVQAVLVDLILAHHRRSSVRELVSRSFSLLARKMVERNANHGEHYIARDRTEYRAMLRAAMWGGFITAFTALIKLGITGLGLAHFFEGAFLSINFALSFLLITAIGGVLATKQPAVTAPALAAQMGELDTVEGLRELLARIAALLRSQAAAVFGNLLAVAPVVIVLSFAAMLIFGKPLMNQEKAYATIHSLSIVGVTPLFAAFTGLLLWLASLMAGFADNWFALRRLRESIAHHRRLVHALGAPRAERWANWLEHNVSSIVGNVSLAILLGMMPVIAQFFGLPLDVRHVTLSTATLAAAVSSIGWEAMATPQFWLACAGIFAIGVLNVGVAFSCALALALRARDVPKRVRRLVFRAVLRRFTLTPYIFFWPTKPENAVAVETAGEQLNEQGRDVSRTILQRKD
ncbi:site-specific recombinase [Herminiimonas fonticola]|uniref:Site-specific recombinase n=1 Tax=Herminiimonas fonticola TaxID=303380 RepID=A0A4R6G5I8_9BURK|nr:site-specific recombinase [Herminiimonas fonticola]RBA23690.1 Site-specific recombinase [Herminiimonas fonticola]TDN89692.1 site-specific recombinase [Herminiimonas fonticola]